MSLTVWLDLIRQRFSPEDGQILVKSLQHDPLVWQFIQDEATSMPYFESAPADLNAFAPGKMATWLLEQTTGVSLSDIGQSNFNLPNPLKGRAAQALETTFNTGLPPSDLLSAGLLALTLHERRLRKSSWKGVSDEIFIHRNQQSIAKNYRIWQTPFTCLFHFCPDFEDLSSDFTTSSSEIIRKTYIPIFVHSLITNPMPSSLLIDQLFGLMKHLSIDLQLEGLRWLRDFRQDQAQTQLAKHLLQNKDNRDFVAGVISEIEAYEAVSPDVDPLDKLVRFSLPEDVNRLAAFFFFSGNAQKANETYHKSSDLLEFLKTQTLFQTLAGERAHIPPSRWLEVIKSIPHSKQARLFYARALIAEQQTEEAHKQLKELPQTIQQQLLLNQTNVESHAPINALLKTNSTALSTHGMFLPQASYYIHQTHFSAQKEILNAFHQEENLEEGLPWLEKYLQANFNDLNAVKLARDTYHKSNQYERAIELTAYLERAEPNVIEHKRSLARLFAQAERWQDAFSFLQTLVNTESSTEIEDLEMFAEAAVRTNQTEIGMSICQNILKRSTNHPKALVLLGEIYMQKGDVLKAIQHMESVVEWIPNEPEAWLTLAWLWAKNDQSDRAVETLKKGITIIPDQPQLLRALGQAFLEKQALTEALDAYIQAYDLEPNHIQGKMDLASVYYQIGQPENGYPLLEAYSRNYQQHPSVARLLGHILVALDKNATAEPILLFSAEHFPDDLNTVLAASQVVLDRVESDPEIEPEAILAKVASILKASSQAHPDQPEISRHLADIDRMNGQHQQAFDVYSRLAKAVDQEKFSTEWRLKYGLGQAALGVGNLEVGLAALQDALGIQPGNLVIRHALADALQAADLPGKANAMAKSALRMEPQDLNNILWYAKFKTKTNDPGEAVRALKEALQITPERHELKLWLAKTMISTGSIEEAHESIAEFINSSTPNPELLHQAGYVCVHLNDLDLAAQALEKAQQLMSKISPALLLDLAIIYSINNHHKKALDILEVDQNLMAEYPQIALIKADLLSIIGQYDLACTTLTSIEAIAEKALAENSNNSTLKSRSPLLYAHDLTLDGYHLRLGQLFRALGKFEEAQTHFTTAMDNNPEDNKLRNAHIENAMVGLDRQFALNLIEGIDLPNLQDSKVSHDLLDQICSRVEILLYQEDYQQATALFNQLSQVAGNYPRYLAIQSRIALNLGEVSTAKEHLVDAIKSFNDSIGDLRSQSLSVVFRQIINLNSIAEASLSLGNILEAIQIWERIYAQLNSQKLFNWRYLYALVTGAEAHQVAKTLAITAHTPGELCLSNDHHKMADQLLTDLNNVLPQDQIVCLNARIQSAFTGTWPTHLNIDRCLQGPDEAAAVLIGSEDESLVQNILESYPDDIQVLQAYGIYALRHNKHDAIPYIEKALTIEAADPINHVLLAHLYRDQPEHALKSIENALRFWPEELEWHALAADLYARIGNTEMAQAHIHYALDHQPENAGYWQQSALIQIQKDDFEQAKSDLEMSTAYQPDDPKAWATMSEINRRMGDVSDALTNIRKASLLDPNNQNLVDTEMQLLYDQKKFAELETRSTTVLTTDSANEKAHIFLAQALAKQGKFSQALEVLDNVLNKIPGDVKIALEYMKIQKDQVGVEKALPDLISLAQANPENPIVLTALTDWLIQANRIDEAEKVAQTTLRIVPEQAEIYLMLGRLQRAKGKLDQAITHLSEAITLDPTLIEAYIELGKTYQERRDLDKAILTFEKGSHADKSDPRPYFYAGLALKDIKDYPGAELMLKQAKKFSPDDANIIRQLGVVTALNLVNNLREAK